MKKYVLLFMSAGLISLASTAQMKASLGPTAGVGGAWISNFDKSEWKTAGNVGLALIYSGHSNFGFGADLKYSIEGGERQFTTPVFGTQLNSTEKANLNYVRLPIKIMYFFGKFGQRVRPKVSLGPSVGFLVGGKTNTRTETQSGAFIAESSVKSKDLWKGFDVGVHGTAGINYRMIKNTWLSVDVAYLHGLIDARKSDQKNMAGYAADRKHMNRNLGLNLGIYYGF